MARRRWHVDHAAEVAALKKAGHSTTDLAAKFKKSETTILNALRHAESLSESEDGTPSPET
jgi:hypothetical protein